MTNKRNEYLTPDIDILPICDILTKSDNVPEFGEDENELPKQDW